MKPIPFLRPNLVKREAYWKYLEEIDESRLYSNFGPLNTLLEKRILSDYFQSQGAVSTVSNATVGLMLAISHLKRQGGRYALMPSFTFAATPLAAMWCGLEPYFIDIRPDDWCMDEVQLDKVLQKLGEEIAVVVPYASFGTCFDLTYYRDLHQAGVPIVIDAAASFGARNDYGQFGLSFPGAVVFSFHATKAFAIGEGGLIYSGQQDSIACIRQAANFGFSANRESSFLGLNAKLSEYSAAIGLATLEIFQKKANLRQGIHDEYYYQFEKIGLFDQGWKMQATNGQIPYQFVSVMCPEDRSNMDIVNQLRLSQIECRTYFSPACHAQPSFRHFSSISLFQTDHVSRRIVSLPLWEEMTSEEINSVVCALVN